MRRIPVDDFDDGGTPMWRARQRQVILEAPERGLIGWYHRTPFWALLTLVIFFSGILPWLIIVGGIALMVVDDLLHRLFHWLF